jgi:hypothetical protein
MKKEKMLRLLAGLGRWNGRLAFEDGDFAMPEHGVKL